MTDAKFPDTVTMISSRTTLMETQKAKILGENARRLFTRLA